MEMSQDHIHALPHLEKAILELDKNFDAFNPKETSAPIDALYHLGRAYHLSENIVKAKEYYNRFLTESSDKSELVFFAKMRLDQCAIAEKLIETPKKVTIKNLGSSVNSNVPEYSPVVSLDGSALFFTSRRLWENGSSKAYIDPRYNMPPEDIYVSYKDFDGSWVEPTRIDFSSSSSNEATMAVSPDERRVYVYIDSVGNGDIFYSDFSTNKFQELQYFNERLINGSKSWETHCTVTPDGQQMYFVSDRQGADSYGGRDIYRTVKLPDGSWSKPVNCGPKINTKFDEESPFIAVDNKTLYFASAGEKSMGGFDIFVAVLDENNVFSDPINLGYPVNSCGDDLFYTTTTDGFTGYLTSFRKDGFGEKDIYEIQNDYLGVSNIAVLKGRINTYNNEPLPEDVSITLKCLNCGNPVDKKVFPRMRDGVFMSSLEPCREYEMIFSYEGGKNEFYKEKFSTDCKKEYQDVDREVWLDTKTKEISHPYTFIGDVKDAKSSEKIENVKVNIYDNETNELLGTIYTDKNGNFSSDTMRNFAYGTSKNLRFDIEKEGYLKTSTNLKVDFADKNQIDISKLINTSLIKKEIGGDIAFAINPIYYDFDKSNIRPDAAIELDKIVTIMKNNPTMKIALGSHTDARGNDAYNLSLSDRRAKAATKYIISKGVSAKRITGNGYGETKLKNKCANDMECSDPEHQENRRTEFIIVK